MPTMVAKQETNPNAMPGVHMVTAPPRNAEPRCRPSPAERQQDMPGRIGRGGQTGSFCRLRKILFVHIRPAEHVGVASGELSLVQNLADPLAIASIVALVLDLSLD